MNNIIRAFVLFVVIGFLYYNVELIFRGYSHISMFLLAGLCGVLFIDTPNNLYSYDLNYLVQVGISTILCTIAEGICGVIVNIWLNLGVWNYSKLWGTFFFNQCNVFFVGAWILIIGFVGIPLCDFINYYWFNIEPCPYYKINGKIVFKFKKKK